MENKELIEEYVPGNIISEKIKLEIRNYFLNPDILWKEIYKNNNTTIFKNLDILSKREYFKIEEIIDTSPHFIFELFYNIKERKDWDEYCQDSKIIEEYDPYNYVYYISYSSTIPTQTPVDLCVFRSCSINHDNSEYLIAERSVIHDQVPLKEGFRRVGKFIYLSMNNIF